MSIITEKMVIDYYRHGNASNQNNSKQSPHNMQILTKVEFSQQVLLVVTLAIRQDFTKIRLGEPNCSMRTDRQTDRYDESYKFFIEIS
jgi:hypothetical protein